MPRIEIEWDRYGRLFWHKFGAHFSSRNFLQHIAQPVESERPIKTVFVRLSFRSQFVKVVS